MMRDVPFYSTKIGKRTSPWYFSHQGWVGRDRVDIYRTEDDTKEMSLPAGAEFPFELDGRKPSLAERIERRRRLKADERTSVP